MKDFAVRAVSLSLCILAILTYNVALELRSKDEDIARLTAELEAAASTQAADAGAYVDGTYRGEAMGYSDLITIELTVSDGKISGIEIVSAPGEDPAYLSMASGLIPQMLEAQTTEVDAVSGATMSSVGIINAAGTALNLAIPE